MHIEQRVGAVDISIIGSLTKVLECDSAITNSVYIASPIDVDLKAHVQDCDAFRHLFWVRQLVISAEVRNTSHVIVFFVDAYEAQTNHVSTEAAHRQIGDSTIYLIGNQFKQNSILDF